MIQSIMIINQIITNESVYWHQMCLLYYKNMVVLSWFKSQSKQLGHFVFSVSVTLLCFYLIHHHYNKLLDVQEKKLNRLILILLRRE